MVKKCKCKNEYQDKRYGKDMRVMNSLQKGNSGKATYRCTVCLAIK